MVVNVEYYGKIVEEKLILCCLICIVMYIVLEGYVREDEVEVLLNEVEKNILEVV